VGDQQRNADPQQQREALKAIEINQAYHLGRSFPVSQWTQLPFLKLSGVVTSKQRSHFSCLLCVWEALMFVVPGMWPGVSLDRGGTIAISPGPVSK
jgi:hypothetical protein